MHVAFIEDDPVLARSVSKAVIEAGHECMVVPDGEKAIRGQVLLGSDLVLLDLMLPKADGIEVLRQARAAGVRTPVIVLTARGTMPDKLQGFAAGADDYLVKPFEFDELMARIEAILRRSADLRPQHARVGDVTIDLEQQKAARAGKPLEMSNIEFRLLEFLARNKNQAVSRAAIAKEIWGHENYKETNVIDVYMGYLRTALDGGQTTKMIFDTFDGGFVLRG